MSCFLIPCAYRLLLVIFMFKYYPSFSSHYQNNNENNNLNLKRSARYISRRGSIQIRQLNLPCHERSFLTAVKQTNKQTNPNKTRKQAWEQEIQSRAEDPVRKERNKDKMSQFHWNLLLNVLRGGKSLLNRKKNMCVLSINPPKE